MVDFVGKIWYNARREGFYSLAPFCIFPVMRVTKFWKIPDWKNLEADYIFQKNSCQLRTNALAGFFKFPRNIVYVYIDICMYIL